MPTYAIESELNSARFCLQKYIIVRRQTHRYLFTIKKAFEQYFLPFSLFPSLIKGQYKGRKGLLYMRKILMSNKITIHIRVVAFQLF